jgi:5-methylcytosine-specific restriction endonuclease McrA
LKQYSTITLKVRDKSELAEYRKLFIENVHDYVGSKCFVCGDKSENRHHIIALSNGGTNLKNNIVPLCRACHSRIHPWL